MTLYCLALLITSPSHHPKAREIALQQAGPAVECMACVVLVNFSEG